MEVLPVCVHLYINSTVIKERDLGTPKDWKAVSAEALECKGEADSSES